MKIESITHSLSTEDGETDITVVLINKKGDKHALLIEDKIDAPAMYEQHLRYIKRGNKSVQEGKYNSFSVFIIAPSLYLKGNTEAGKYENSISYEELAELFPVNSFERQMIDEAIKEKQKGYEPVEDSIVTEFWRDYYVFLEKEYPNLKPYYYEGARGSAACWSTFRLSIPKTKIQYKANRGYMDLEIAAYADKMDEFSVDNADVLENDMIVAQAGKSLAVRIIVPIISFRQPFSNCVEEMRKSMNEAVRLQNIASKLVIERN